MLQPWQRGEAARIRCLFQAFHSLNPSIHACPPILSHRMSHRTTHQATSQPSPKLQAHRHRQLHNPKRAYRRAKSSTAKLEPLAARRSHLQTFAEPALAGFQGGHQAKCRPTRLLPRLLAVKIVGQHLLGCDPARSRLGTVPGGARGGRDPTPGEGERGTRGL